jgi:hypothetical protein
MVAEQILSDLKLEGSYRAQGRLDHQLTIVRNHAISPQRIIYTPDQQTLRIERQEFRANAFLERMHRRRGYEQNFWSDDLWALSVDLFILATVLWVGSGLWMWWELKVTRTWGAVCIVSGISLFAFFLVSI